MLNIFLQQKDIIQLTSSSSVNYCYVSCDRQLYNFFSNLGISNFPLIAKNQKPTKEITYFAKYFSLFANYSFN